MLNILNLRKVTENIQKMLVFWVLGVNNSLLIQTNVTKVEVIQLQKNKAFLLK